MSEVTSYSPQQMGERDIIDKDERKRNEGSMDFDLTRCGAARRERERESRVVS